MPTLLFIDKKPMKWAIFIAGQQTLLWQTKGYFIAADSRKDSFPPMI